MGRRSCTHRCGRYGIRQRPAHRVNVVERLHLVATLCSRPEAGVLSRKQILPFKRRDGALQLILRHCKEIPDNRICQRCMGHCRQQDMRGLPQIERRSEMDVERRHRDDSRGGAHQHHRRHTRRLRHLHRRLWLLQDNSRAAAGGRRGDSQLCLVLHRNKPALHS